MITVIEGVDGSGKTTLCKRLEKDGFVLIGLPERQENKDEEYSLWRIFCDTYCTYKKEKVAIISDRSLISEIVYRMQDYQQSFLNESLFKKFLVGLQVVYCYSDTSYKDAMERGDDNISSEFQHVSRSILYNGFMYFLQEVYKVPICIYNWKEKKDYNKVVKFIKRSISK